MEEAQPKRKYKFMRRRYDRIDATELSRRLNDLGMSARELADLSGAAEHRVVKWLRGEEDIPPHIDLLTLTWMAFPETRDKALEWMNATSFYDESDLIP